MADVSRQEKLAAARKKLKKFKKEKESKTPDGSPVNRSNKELAQPEKNKEKQVPNGPKKAIITNGSEISHSVSTPSQKNYSSSNGVSTISENDLQSKKPTVSTERIHQLSRQINGLITESTSYLNGVEETEIGQVSDLEGRNRDLAGLLEDHGKENQQMTKQLDQLKSQNTKLHEQLEVEKKHHEEKLKRELGSLKDQLQVHIQTIGILVAEKTELQSSLNQSQKNAEQRLQEVEELSGRLKASRQRVADLERNYSTASSSSEKHEQSSKKYSKDVDRLKIDLYKANKSCEESQQRNSELQGKLQEKVNQCIKLEDSMIELKGKLEMTELYVQQLQNQGIESETSQEQVQQLMTEKAELQSRVTQYEDAFQKLTSERDQLSEQFQQYIDQLKERDQQLQEQISLLSEEKFQLLQKVEELNSVITNLQATIGSLSSNTEEHSPDAVDSNKENSEETNVRLSETTEAMQKIKQEYEALSVHYQNQVQDNAQLSRLVEEKEMAILEFEQRLSRMQDDSVDKSQLLENMQSDKTALSRATAQNKELKNQLAELQNGFVKMSNDNMDVLSKLQGEQHVSKELATRLSQQEDELKEIREQLSVKEHELHLMQSSSDSMHVQHYTNEQIEDRLRHYEAQTKLIETLQKELSNAQDNINALTTQNSELRGKVLKAENMANGNNNEQHEVVESLNSSVRQLEMERNQIMEELKEVENKHKEADHKLQDLLNNHVPATLNGDVISKGQFDVLHHSMKQLEGKYTKAMRDQADLSDTNEQLEHRIMQLQGETDTIGEYITLYQTQRSILKQRQEEKDFYISQLARERGDMQEKFCELQALVMQLLRDRQTINSYNDSQSLAMTGNVNHLAQSTPNSGHPADKGFGANLDSSQLEDWPDYSTDTDSDVSEVEAIVASSAQPVQPPETTPANQATQQTSANTDLNVNATDTNSETSGTDAGAKWNPPKTDQTAQQIMHLLTEIGHSRLLPGKMTREHFLHCNHCSGRIYDV